MAAAQIGAVSNGMHSMATLGKDRFEMEAKFLPHLSILAVALVAAWYFDGLTVGFFQKSHRKSANAVDELLKKKHHVVGNECIPETTTCFLIVDSYYLENNRLTTKRDLLLAGNKDYSLTGVEVQSSKQVSWDNIDSRDWPVNKLVINARYARLLIASGFIMDSLTFDENDHQDVLVAGLGGGVMSNFLSEVSFLNINTVVVEKEEFIINIAETYFDHFETENLKIVHSDVITYLKNNDKKFDVIIMDACENKVTDVNVICPVSEVLQEESIKLLKKRLTLTGTLAINVYISKQSIEEETKIFDMFSKEFKSCFYLEYFQGKKLLNLLFRPAEETLEQYLLRLHQYNSAVQLFFLQYQLNMLNQQQGQQLLNVQRPHQIQPPGQHRMVPVQVLQANQIQQGGQPVQIRIQGDPINIPHAQMVNMQGQRVQQAPMGQQMQPQQQNMGMNNMLQMRQQQNPPQQQQMMNQNQNQQQQGQNQNQMQHQPQIQQLNQPQQQQMRGNNMNQNQNSNQQHQNQNPNQQIRMGGPPQQQQMRMQSGQHMNAPQQRMGTPNMQQQQQQRMGQGPAQQQQQMRQHQMQQQGQNLSGPQGQQIQQGVQPLMNGPSPQVRMQQQNQQQHAQQEPQQQQQFQMQQNQQNMNGPQAHQQQQMHQNQHNGPAQQQQMRMQPQEQMKQEQQQPNHMNGPQQPQMQQGQQMRQQPQQHMQQQQQRVQQQQQPHFQNQQQPQQQQQQMSQQNQGMRGGQMQNSPQPIRINPQPAPQMMQQGRQQMQQGRVMPNQMRQQKVMQPIAPAPAQDHQMQQQQQQQQQPVQVINQENGPTVRINGDRTIIDGQQYRVMQVAPQQRTVDISQLQHVGTTVASETRQFHQQMQQNDGQQQQQQQQRPQLQQRNSTHQLIPMSNIQNQPIGMSSQPQNRQMVQNQQGNMQAPQQTAQPPPKAPRQRNRAKKNNNAEQQQQNQQPNQQQNQQQSQQQSQQQNQQQNQQLQNQNQQNMQQPQQMMNQNQNQNQNQQIRQNGQQIMQENSGGRNVATPRGRQRPQPAAPNAQQKNNPDFDVPQGTLVRQGKHMVLVGGPPQEIKEGDVDAPNNQQQQQQQQTPMRLNGPQQQQPSTSSQPSTSQQPPADLISIKDAMNLHLRGERKMLPDYVEYCIAQLTRIQHEMEKGKFTNDLRYRSVQKLIALLKGVDFSTIVTPPRPARTVRQPPTDGPLPDVPENETPEERQKRFDGYMENLKNAYPIIKDDRVFPGLPPEVIRQEAQFYIKQDMQARANYLKANMDKLPEEEKVKAKIEYYGLNLVELQEKVRKEVAATLVFTPPTEFLINPWSIRRSKAEYNQELKAHPDRFALEKKRRMTNNALLQNLSKHYREFREFHKGQMTKHTKVRKAMQTYITNEAKKKTREEMKNEKVRIQKLIQEDEDGYRAMLDDKKDQRLVYLLEQTDGYIESLCDLLKQQKSTTETALRSNPQNDSGLASSSKTKSILEKARNDDDEYEDKAKLNFEDYYTTAHGIREVITEQHHMMGGGNPNLKLKPYQLKGLEWMVSLYNNNLNGILADEMGLGKTIQSISFITYLMEKKKNPGPYLVIVPLSTVPNWQNEFEKWAENVDLIVYKGNKDHRKAVEPRIKAAKFNVLLTTFEYVIKEKALLGKLRWKYMLIDEGHRLKNQHSKLTEMLNSRFQCPRRLLITGTPLQNNLPELWALLNFLLPSIFSSCTTFEQWFNAPFATTGEKVELTQEETMLIIRRLHKVLRPFLLRRLKKEVESELPDKTEFVIKCEMSALQKVLYKHMQKGLLLDGKQNSGSRSLMNSMVHLRKLCNHPFLFNNVEDSCRLFWDVKYITGTDLFRVSGKLELLDRILPKLQATGHRVLMFFQMTSMMTIVEDYLAVKTIQYLRLDGSTKPDERGGLLDKFNAPNSKYFLFMLSTRAGGLGLNLQTADTVIIFDSDWNPHQDMQAQDRAHRIGQKQEVRVFRLITANSIEEKILASAKFKLNVDEKVIQAGKFDNRSTGAERKEILEQIIKAENEADDNDDLPSDEDINYMLARKENEFEIFQRMDRERIDHDRFHGVKPRLVGDNEIPKDILRAADETEYQEKAKEEGRVAYLEVMPGSRRKRKEVNYSSDTMSDDKFLETLLDGEDPTAIRPEPEIVVITPEKPSTSSQPPEPTLTFKVPRLTFKLGEEAKRKHQSSGSDSDAEERKKEKHRKRKLEGDQPIQKLKIKFFGEPSEKAIKSTVSSEDERTPTKRKQHSDSDDGHSEKKKKKNKHESPSNPEVVAVPTPEYQPLKLKFNVRFDKPNEVFPIPTRTPEEQQRSEQKKKLRENETEEERRARKAAKKERKRQEALEEEARIEAKKARKEQRRLEKEAAAGSASAAGSA